MCHLEALAKKAVMFNDTRALSFSLSQFLPSNEMFFYCMDESASVLF